MGGEEKEEEEERRKGRECHSLLLME